MAQLLISTSQFCARSDTSAKAASVGPTKKNQDLNKTRLCVYYLRGSCNAGGSCRYAHDVSEIRSTPNLTKTQLCVKFMNGNCCNKACTYAHGEAELVQPPNFKKKMCAWFRDGDCRYGSKCAFAHSLPECREGQSAFAHSLRPGSVEEAERATAEFNDLAATPHVFAPPGLDAGEASLQNASDNLYVWKLPMDSDANFLTQLFGQVGTVKSVKHIADKGYGFVRMSTVEEAMLAVKEVNGFECSGTTINVKYAEPPGAKQKLPGAKLGFSGTPLRKAEASDDGETSVSTDVPSSHSRVESDTTADTSDLVGTTRREARRDAYLEARRDECSTRKNPEENLFRMMAARGSAPLQHQVASVGLAIGDLQTKLDQVKNAAALQAQVEHMQHAIHQLSEQCADMKVPESSKHRKRNDAASRVPPTTQRCVRVASVSKPTTKTLWEQYGARASFGVIALALMVMVELTLN